MTLGYEKIKRGTIAEWTAATVAQRLVPLGAMAAVVDDDDVVLYTVIGDGVTDLFALPTNTGVKSIDFDEEITFQGQSKSFLNLNEDAENKVLTLNATQPLVGDHYHTLYVLGNGTNTVTMPVGVNVVGSLDLDLNALNEVTLAYSIIDGITLTISQQTNVIITQKDLDLNTPPSVLSAEITNDYTDQLIVTLDKDSDITDTTGLSFDGGLSDLTIDSVLSGDGTDEIIFQLSGDATAAMTGNFVFGISNTITAVDGGLGLAAGSISVDNSIISSIVLDSLTNISRTDISYFKNTASVVTAFGSCTTHKLEGDGSVEFTVVDDNILIGLDDSPTANTFISWAFGVRLRSSFTSFQLIEENVEVSSSVVADIVAGTSKIKIDRVGTTITARLAVDGSTYSETIVSATSSTGDLYAKINQGAGNALNSEMRDVILTGFTAV